MTKLIKLPTITDERGHLTVLENCLPFSIKRIYWMYQLNEKSRGGHRHKMTRQAAVLIAGECDFLIKNSTGESVIHLDKPDQCLIIEPEDWHVLKSFKPNTVVLMIASELYDPSDYINEPLAI